MAIKEEIIAMKGEYLPNQSLTKFIRLMPKIREIALINREYFEEAERVCDSLRKPQPGLDFARLDFERLFLYARRLNLCAFDVLMRLEEIDNLLKQSKVKIDSDDFNWDDLDFPTYYHIEEKAKYVCSQISDFERQTRKDTVGMIAIKKHVEPKMAMYYKNLMNDEQKKQESPSNKPESNDNPNETSVEL